MIASALDPHLHSNPASSPQEFPGTNAYTSAQVLRRLKNCITPQGTGCTLSKVLNLWPPDPQALYPAGCQDLSSG